MQPTSDTIRALLDPLMREIKDPVDFNRESLFACREVLKSVFDEIDQRKEKTAADGFGAIQAMVGSMIRRGHVDQITALKAIDVLLENILGSMGDSAGSGFSLGGGSNIPDVPNAAQYLQLGGGYSAPDQSADPAATAAPNMSLDTGNGHCLGRLLVHSGKISEGQLNRALDLQQINGRRLGDVLIAMEAIGIQTLEEALQRQQTLSKPDPS